MTTLHFPHWAGSSSPWQDRIQPVQLKQALLWSGGTLATCAVVFMLVLGPGKAMFREAVSMELAPGSTGLLQQAWTAGGTGAEDPFYKQKVDAKAEELPAQF